MHRVTPFLSIQKEYPMRVCYLVGAGAFTARGLHPVQGDCVIAADGGYTTLAKRGIVPDLLVGDFDSLKQIPEDVPRKAYRPEKDDTDMALALEEGIARGYRSFAFYDGASGGRADHTHANLQILGGASKKWAGLQDGMPPPTMCMPLPNGSLRAPKGKSGRVVSVFCHGNRADGVTLRGLKYPLTDAVLTSDRPLGVSNETTGEDAVITVKTGTLLVYVMFRSASKEKGRA